MKPIESKATVEARRRGRENSYRPSMTDQDRAAQVLPCPFCGGEARVCWGGDGMGDTLTAVECYGCEARGETIFSPGIKEPLESIKNMAIARWNERPYGQEQFRAGVEASRNKIAYILRLDIKDPGVFAIVYRHFNEGMDSLIAEQEKG